MFIQLNNIYKGVNKMEYLEQLIQELEKSLANRYIGDDDYIESLEQDITTRMNIVHGSI